MSGSSPLLQAAKQRTSARGATYMSGRLGGVRVVIMPNRAFAEDDPANSHTHFLFFQYGSTAAPQAHPSERAPTMPREPRSRKATPGGPMDDDLVPF